MSDGWSSLDESIRSEHDSFIATSSSSQSESESWTDETSSSSSPQESQQEEEVVQATPFSQKSTNPVTPVSAKQVRKSVLDSLVAKKRRLSSSSVPLEVVSSSPEEEESSEFVVSDNDEMSSFSGDDDPGFYARVSHMLDRKERKEKAFSESFSQRGAFHQLMIYYAVCLVSKDCEFPTKIKALKKQLPSFKAALRKIEKEITSRRDITRPSYWKPDSDFLKILNAFPNMRSFPYRCQFSDDGQCDGCLRNNRLSVVVTLGGHTYNSKAVWEGNLKHWTKSMKLPFLNRETSSASSSDDDYEVFEPGSHFNLGGVCASNVRIYHILNHWKHSQLMKLYNWIVSRRLAGDLKKLVETLENEKGGIVEQWFEQFEECTTLSEKNCDKFTDPLGSHSPSARQVRKSVHGSDDQSFISSD